jgi:phenylacetate-CoA ligase
MRTAHIAFPCPDATHYHVQDEVVLLEAVDAASRPCASGQTGRVLLTPLLNYAMRSCATRSADDAERGKYENFMAELAG